MSNHPYPRRAWRLAGAAGLTVGLAAGGYGVASAASGSTTTTSPSAGPSTSNPSGGTATPPAGRPRTPGPKAPGGRRGGSGTITALTATTITVSGPNGVAHQITTDASTTYHRDGQTAQRSDLAVGERVAIRAAKPSTPASGSAGSAAQPVTAQDVDILSPAMNGVVASINGSTITITDGQGFTRTIHTSGSTTYDLAGQAATANDVKVGSAIRAVGTIDANKTDLDATKVSVIQPRVAGTVQSAANGTITLTEPGGGTQKITTTPSTVYKSGGNTAAFADIKAGDFLSATGQMQPDGSMVASTVNFGTRPQPAGPGGRAGFGPGGFGPGGFGPGGFGPFGRHGSGGTAPTGNAGTAPSGNAGTGSA